MVKASYQSSTNKQTALRIIEARKTPIRSTLKLGNDYQKALLQVELMNSLDAIIDVYTNADFSKKTAADKELVFRAMTDFIFDKFPMLGVLEIKEAFALASAGHTDADLRTFHGKFTVSMLGSVLSSYLAYTKQLIFLYEKEKDSKEKEFKMKQEQEEKNLSAKKQVIESFLELKEAYKKVNEIDESKIFIHWGRILVDAGHIKFTEQEKKDIYQEAKELVKKDLASQLKESEKATERRELRSLIDIINSNPASSESFKAKCTAKYSLLVVKKAIINSK